MFLDSCETNIRRHSEETFELVKTFENICNTHILQETSWTISPEKDIEATRAETSDRLGPSQTFSFLCLSGKVVFFLCCIFLIKSFTVGKKTEVEGESVISGESKVILSLLSKNNINYR